MLKDMQHFNTDLTEYLFGFDRIAELVPSFPLNCVEIMHVFS